MKKIRLNVEQLPELRTEVALSRSAKQQEVAGAVCIAVGAGIAIYMAM